MDLVIELILAALVPLAFYLGHHQGRIDERCDEERRCLEARLREIGR